MDSILLISAVALLLCLSLTPAVRRVAFQLDLVDQPDDKRKVHRKPVPRVGGIAVTFSYFGAFLVLSGVLPQMPLAHDLEANAMLHIAPAVLLVFLAGLVDDIFGLKPWHKFGIEVIAGTLVVASGIHIHPFANVSISSTLEAIATVLWLVACSNALNLIDGLDGLAAGVALLATTTILLGALLLGNIGLAIATAPLLATLVGFLIFNTNPASIFLGDSGSLVLGFLLGTFSVVWASSARTVAGVAAPLLALAVPLLDTTLAISRRFLSGKPIFLPDRSHMHHRLLARGLSHRHAVLSLYVAALVAGLFSLGFACTPDTWKIVVLIAFCGAVICGVRLLAYAEFEAVGQLMAPKMFRRQISALIALRQFAHDLAKAETPDECWLTIQNASQEFGLHLARMQFGNQSFFSPRAATDSSGMVMRIPICNEHWVELVPGSSPCSYTNTAVPFADTIQKILTDKTSEMRPSRQEQRAHKHAASGMVGPVLTQQVFRSDSKAIPAVEF